MNLLFDEHVLKWPRYYGIYACSSQRIQAFLIYNRNSQEIKKNCFDLQA